MDMWSALKNKFEKMMRSVRRFARSHPKQLMLLVGVLTLFAVQISVIATTAVRQNQEADRISTMPTVTLQELKKMSEAGEVKKIISHDIEIGSFFYPERRSYLEIVDQNNKSFAWEKTSSALMGEEFGKMLFNNSTEHPILFETGAVIVPNSLSGFINTMLIVFVLIIVIITAQTMITEVIGGHSFTAQKPNDDLTLDDVIGYDEVKKQLREIKDQLIHANEYADMGIVAPKGVLFTGDPGVGKTMMANALANELGADFFSCTGADFAEMYVGVGPRRVRSLFRIARQSALAIIFIDEIDALGSRDTMGNDSERLNTLNAMLSEMDGVNQNGRLLVVGATNHPGRLDAALRRPGRFDRSVHIPLPDTQTREGILNHYLKNIPTKDIDARALALRTQGHSGAQLKNIVDEAKQLALREASGQPWVVNQDVLQRAQEIALIGSVETPPKPLDVQRVATHELGHALTGFVHCPEILVEKATLKGRGGALGYAFSRPLEDQSLTSFEQMQGRLVMLLGGRAAEEVVMGSISGGAADDLQKANDIARAMVLQLGFGQRTKLALPQRGVDGEYRLTQNMIDDIQEILSEAYDQAKKTVEQNKMWFDQKVQELMEKQTLMHDELFPDNSVLK